jgi:hypothetical protein
MYHQLTPTGHWFIDIFIFFYKQIAPLALNAVFNHNFNSMMTADNYIESQFLEIPPDTKKIKNGICIDGQRPSFSPTKFWKLRRAASSRILRLAGDRSEIAFS